MEFVFIYYPSIFYRSTVKTFWQVKLCGHATLASAYTLFTAGLVNSNIIEFDTLSGILTAKKDPDFKAPTEVPQIQNGEEHQHCFSVELDFPTVPNTEFNSTEVSAISKALNGAAIIDIKRTTPFDELLVIPQLLLPFSCLLLHMHCIIFLTVFFLRRIIY